MPADAQPDPRVFLAIERTFLAWTRTALALMGFGFVVARLGLLLREFALAGISGPARDAAADGVESILLGGGLVLVGVAIQTIALIEHVRRVRTFHRGVPIAPMRARLGVLIAGVVIAIGLMMTAYLILTGRG